MGPKSTSRVAGGGGKSSTDGWTYRNNPKWRGKTPDVGVAYPRVQFVRDGLRFVG